MIHSFGTAGQTRKGRRPKMVKSNLLVIITLSFGMT